MSLDDALAEFGDLINRPRSLAEQASKGPQPYQPVKEGTPPNLRNVNINQFALPGMEEHSHPLARHLAEGVKFGMTTDKDEHKEDAHLPWKQRRMQDYEHNLHAWDDQGNVARLIWAGEGRERRPEGGGLYPGEIAMVEKREERPHYKGIAQDMFKAAHTMGMGQSTVPVHSPNRTGQGEAWANKTGPEELVPPRYDYDWRPPSNIHPSEQRLISQAQFNPPPNDQPPLPGLEGHSHERKVDLSHVLENWFK